MLERIKAIAPGSCMLLGEYAVLFNEPALVCAINRYIEVTLTPLPSSKIIIHSDLGHYQGDLNHLAIEEPFKFVLTSIAMARPSLKNGFILDIKADFSDQYGFGSSAAVTVATTAALLQYSKTAFTPTELLIKARSTIQQVQGNGSGADVAASVFGGLVSYEKAPLKVKKLRFEPNIHLIYSGKKVRTKEVIRHTITHYHRDLDFQNVIKRCRKTHLLALKGIEHKEWPILDLAMETHQAFLELLGTNTKTLHKLIKACKNIPTLHGTKISGAGFGDCIITLGELPPNTFPRNRREAKKGIKQFDIKLAPVGVEISVEPGL